ncbi:MAG: hypothetical protein GY739_18990, partial [Mesoflavibacter sp.]|nr:hypothetical protein [Mesoflavibacter sp.]
DHPVEDEDPKDEILDEFLKEHPEKNNYFGILRNIRDVIDEVIFKGEDKAIENIFPILFLRSDAVTVSIFN